MIGTFALSAGWWNGAAELCLVRDKQGRDRVRTLEQARSSGISKKARMWRSSSSHRPSRIRGGLAVVAAIEG